MGEIIDGGVRGQNGSDRLSSNGVAEHVQQGRQQQHKEPLQQVPQDQRKDTCRL